MGDIEKSMLETYRKNSMLVVISMDDKEEYECTITAYDDEVIVVKEYDGRDSVIYRKYIKKIATSKRSN